MLHLFIQYILNDRQISDKTELTDCYTSKSNIRLISINNQRSFRLYLDPSNKSECAQLPRGINITIFATALIDASSQFIPNSVIIFDFNYSTTVGVTVPCTQCVDEMYFSSDQVIVTFESAIWFTRMVMGAVQTERGLQVNCFKSATSVVDFNTILVKATVSNSCPQLVSADITKLKAISQADFYVVYENGDIDRYEKILVASGLYITNPLNNGINVFNVTIAGVGNKIMNSGFQYIQLQLYFQDNGVPLQAVVQVSTYSFAGFQNAFQNIDLQVQKSGVYLDIAVNKMTVAPGVTLDMVYNNKIFNVMKPDGFLLQFYGYSSVIPSNERLEQPFQAKYGQTSVRTVQLWEVELLFLVYYVSNYILKYFATSNADDKFQQTISSWRLFMNYSLTQDGQKYDFDRIRSQSTIQSQYLIFQKVKIEIATCNKRRARTKINAVEDVQGRPLIHLTNLGRSEAFVFSSFLGPTEEFIKYCINLNQLYHSFKTSLCNFYVLVNKAHL
ncbi:Conserved_hypothetical protein [Hexamita inflata]|uniref:Uncharacterized protein n=1 Tax=Hexamita inflata TaxID=28002 RepID=A0AA86RMU6_9EUKA|nr:Conserved hypothetical protein [Hexamita inflata]